MRIGASARRTRTATRHDICRGQPGRPTQDYDDRGNGMTMAIFLIERNLSCASQLTSDGSAS
jgi:hypothetical protein